jgi:hypothetical protein
MVQKLVFAATPPMTSATQNTDIITCK